MKRHSNVRRAGQYIGLILDQRWCVYCGASATTIDHFVPVSFAAAVATLGVVSGKYLVPACGECNGMANARVFVSIGAKRRYLQGRIAHRYRHILAMPDWPDDEMAQLGHMLRSSIRVALAQREYIRVRLRWRNSDNAEPAKLAAVRFRFIAIGHDTVDVPVMSEPDENDYEKSEANESENWQYCEGCWFAIIRLPRRYCHGCGIKDGSRLRKTPIRRMFRRVVR
jgi:hypothetical protein